METDMIRQWISGALAGAIALSLSAGIASPQIILSAALQAGGVSVVASALRVKRRSRQSPQIPDPWD
jgi:hypothetical protein